MKHLILVALIAFSSVTVFAKDGTMTKEKDGTVIINTTEIASDVQGFKGTTPLKIFIKKGKVVKIEALPNHETPRFFKRITDGGLLEKWNGKKVTKAKDMKVDGITGATYSSNAVKENVVRGLEYYQKNKKK